MNSIFAIFVTLFSSSYCGYIGWPPQYPVAAPIPVPVPAVPIAPALPQYGIKGVPIAPAVAAVPIAPAYAAPIYNDYGAPTPYNFGYKAVDAYGTKQTRQETGDGNGGVTGSYSYIDAYGISRIVEYIADDNGFRANIKTNEPGTETSAPADAIINSAPLLAAKVVAAPVVAPIAYPAQYPIPVAYPSQALYPAQAAYPAPLPAYGRPYKS